MVPKDFKVDDLVWAKMKHFSFWPAKIIDPPADSKIKKGSHYVIFFGTNDFAWISDENIVPHSDEQVQSFSNKKKSPSLQKAIDSIVEEHKIRPKKSEPLVKEITVKEEKTIPTNEVKRSAKKSFPKYTMSSEKKAAKVKRNSSTGERSPKKQRRHSTSKDDVSHNESSIRRQREDLPLLVHNDVPSSVIPYSLSSLHRLTQAHNSELNPIPVLDLQVVSDTLMRKQVIPTAKKIGFVGLGMMGQRMVKNLLHSGHDVTIWNRTPGKCTAFYKAGAHAAMTPADVVTNCDIIFCCVSDAAAVKSLVFGNCGILMGLESKGFEFKGYVEMSSIDPVVSLEIAEAISSKGGKYLEAPANGSLQEADEGALTILAAGDMKLFMDTETCFCAMSRHLYYLGGEIGQGFKMSLVIRSMVGTTCAALAEAMALIDRSSLSTNDFMEILNLGPHTCALLAEKGQRMVQHNFETNTALRHQQNDLNMMLEIGHAFEQPTLIAAAANELYKHARHLHYADHDVSAVVLGVKY